MTRSEKWKERNGKGKIFIPRKDHVIWEREIMSITKKSYDKDTIIASVQSLSHVQIFETSWSTVCRLSCPSLSLGVWTNSCPLRQWCHPIISSSAIPLSSCLQSFPAAGSFQMCQFFASGGQNIGASVSASVLPMNIQDWFPLGLPGLISLQSKGLSRVFSSTTVRGYQFFSIQPSLWFNSHNHKWLCGSQQTLENS